MKGLSILLVLLRLAAAVVKIEMAFGHCSLVEPISGQLVAIILG